MRSILLIGVRIIVTITIIATVAVGVLQTGRYIKGLLSIIAAHPGWSDEEKIHSFYGSFYDLMLYVKQKTPQDSIILIPPSTDPWFTSGNEYMVRSFLYPRTIVRATGNLPDTVQEKTYALVVMGPNQEPWPPQAPATTKYIEPGWGLIDLSRAR